MSHVNKSFWQWWNYSGELFDNYDEIFVCIERKRWVRGENLNCVILYKIIFLSNFLNPDINFNCSKINKNNFFCSVHPLLKTCDITKKRLKSLNPLRSPHDKCENVVNSSNLSKLVFPVSHGQNERTLQIIIHYRT